MSIDDMARAIPDLLRRVEALEAQAQKSAGVNPEAEQLNGSNTAPTGNAVST